METLHLILSNPLLCLFLTLGAGLILGKVSIMGFSLGSAGVLFTSLLVGHFGYSFPDGVGKLGLVLFIYCIGISAGGRFFSALRKEGSRPIIIALVTMISGALILLAGQSLLQLPREIAIGLYAGAMSSAPALAAGAEGLTNSQDVVVGYGIAYPLGILGIILFVQLVPKLLFQKRMEEELAASAMEEEVLQNVLVEVTNAAAIGRNIAEFGLKHLHGCQIARRLNGEILLPLAYEDEFQQGQHILMVGRAEDLEVAIELLGQRSYKHYVRDIEHERKTLQLNASEFVGRSITDIQPLKNHGVMITRITRYGFTFVPERDTELEKRDKLRVIGTPEKIMQFATTIKHRKREQHGDAILSLCIGLTLGIFLGMIPFALPGTPAITLGLAGGPLIVALLFGHFGRIGSLETHIPRAPRDILQMTGLIFFVADAGIRGGADFLETFQTHGLPLLVLGAAITFGSLLCTLLAVSYVLRMSPLSAMGALCGGMTSTPGLGALTSKFSSQIPVINYATIYPVALIIITVTVKMLAAVL